MGSRISSNGSLQWQIKILLDYRNWGLKKGNHASFGALSSPIGSSPEAVALGRLLQILFDNPPLVHYEPTDRCR